jgi:hypothetical protein
MSITLAFFFKQRFPSSRWASANPIVLPQPSAGCRSRTHYWRKIKQTGSELNSLRLNHPADGDKQKSRRCVSGRTGGSPSQHTH